MRQFKNNINYNLIYSDTDCVLLIKPLDDKLINYSCLCESKSKGNILGHMKLEAIIIKAIFITIKVYGYKTKDGNSCLSEATSKGTIIKVKGLTKYIIKTINIILF